MTCYEIGRGEQCLRDLLESITKFFEIAGAYGQSSRGRMPAKFEQQAGIALGNEIQ